RAMRLRLHKWLEDHFKNPVYGPTDAEFLGLEPKQPFEVHTARIAYRANPDGGVTAQMVIGVLQTKRIPVDPKDPVGAKMVFEGGSSIIVDLRKQKVRYCIRKRLRSDTRLERQRQFAVGEFDSLRSTYLGERALGRFTQVTEPFALVHRGS